MQFNEQDHASYPCLILSRSLEALQQRRYRHLRAIMKLWPPDLCPSFLSTGLGVCIAVAL